MSMWCHDDVLDESLNYIKANANRICFCSQQPTTYTEAITTYKIAHVNISSANFTGPANGDVSGRKLTVDAQSEIDIDTDGDITHLALVDTVNEKLLYVTTCPVESFTTPNMVDMPAWDVILPDAQ